MKNPACQPPSGLGLTSTRTGGSGCPSTAELDRSASLALRSQGNAAPAERTRLPSRASALLCVLPVSSEKGRGVLRIQLREAAGAADPRLEARLHLAFE